MVREAPRKADRIFLFMRCTLLVTGGYRTKPWIGLSGCFDSVRQVKIGGVWLPTKNNETVYETNNFYYC
jgi:hypothetical protein